MLGRTFFGIAAAVLLAATGLPAQLQAGSVLPAETEAGRPGDLPPPAARRTPGRPTVIPNTFIVQVEEGADPGPIAAAVARFTGGAVLHVYTHALKGFAIRLPPGLVIADIVAAHPQVLKVEPNLMAFAVAPPGGGPIANDDTAVTNQDTSVTIHVLKNDSGKKLTVTNVTDPPKGAALKTDNAKMVIYSPDTGWSGIDSFGYTITDKDGNTDIATVTVTVNAVDASNTPPVADPQSVVTPEDTALAITLTGSDLDGDTLTFEIVAGPGNGTLGGGPPNVTYTPAADYYGPDSFTFKVNDGKVDSADATVSIDVTPVSDPPVAVNDTATTPKDTPVIIDVLANDSDPDGDTLTVSGVTQPLNGQAAIDPGATTVTYTPDAGFTDSDSFGYTISDGNGGFANATVTVTVTEPSTQGTPPGILRIGANPSPGNCGDLKIAILDTGIDLDHPDLNVDVAMSQDFTGIGSPDDDNGHGSHVAGTAGAIDNLFGVVGVCPGVSLVAYKVLGADGSGSFGGVIAALDQVAANAGVISVVNMSLGGQGFLDALRTAVQGVVNAGVVVAVAAGNSSEDIYGPNGTFESSEDDFDVVACFLFHILCPDDFIPAAYPENATIAAMADYDGQAGGLDPDPVRFVVIPGLVEFDQYDDTLAWFSNHNHDPDFEVSLFVNSPGGGIDAAAPGVEVFSTYKDAGYATISGTSMASPHYAGAVARYILANGGRDQNGDSVIDGADVTLIRQGIVDTAESQFDWRSTPPPTSFIAGIEDDCRPNPRPYTEDIDCNFEPLVDVEAFEAPTS